MNIERLNLSVLTKTRRPPEVEDVFAMHLPDHGYLYGRVVSVEANPLGVGGGVLIYIYGARSQDKEAVPDLRLTQLLVPPVITNNLPWMKGYFEFVEKRPLVPEDRLQQHCFQDVRGWYFDERGRRLSRPFQPVGQWGLHSYRTIDDEIAKALGIPLATSA